MDAAATTAIRPPPEVRWIVDLIGEEAALRLVNSHGGTRLYIPGKPTAQSPLAQVVGLRAAQALGRELGQEYRKIPLARRWRALHLRAAGLGYAEIARRLTASESTVAEWLSDGGLTRQMQLPGL